MDICRVSPLVKIPYLNHAHVLPHLVSLEIKLRTALKTDHMHATVVLAMT